MSDALAAVFDYVKQQRKIDFGVYRPDTVVRRMGQLLSATGSKDYNSYLDLIKKKPSELDRLITTLTITVSQFFRNPEVFNTLSQTVLPQMFETFRDETLRIWCAGCGRGEEAYSLAIILRNIIGDSGDMEMPVLLATDIDEKALKAAAAGRYAKDVLKAVSKEDLDRYFTAEGEHYRISDSVRSMVDFAFNDVTICRPPKEGIFSDYHLIFCRNVLIYFSRETQAKVLRCLSENLRPQGCLALGEAEMLADRDFNEVVPQSRIFRKGGRQQ